MTHSSRTTWIMIFGILAMLMSNYVSSAPSMVMKSMMMSKVVVDNTHSVHSTHSVTSSERDYCHSSTLAKEYPTTQSVNHCDDTDIDTHIHCGSVCSSASFPLANIKTNSEFSSRFAHFNAVKMGEKVSRTQSILRPPSA